MRDRDRRAIGWALSAMFDAFGVEPTEGAFKMYIGSACRALMAEKDEAIGDLVTASVESLIDEWVPSQWRRYPAPSEVRRAIFEMIRSRRRAAAERRLALPMSDEERRDRAREVKVALGELAAELGWPADWRDDAKQEQRSRIREKVKELIREEDEHRARAHREAAQRPAAAKRHRRKQA